MKYIKRLTLVVFIFFHWNISAQQVIKQVEDITGTDTCCIDTYIGEINYFGKNPQKARFYPYFSCIKNDRILCEIIWVPSKRWRQRSKLTEEQLNEYVFGKKENDFKEYPCYAFLQDYYLNKRPDGYIIYEPKFPVIIEVFKYEDGRWVRLFDKEVSSHKELGALKLEVVR